MATAEIIVPERKGDDEEFVAAARRFIDNTAMTAKGFGVHDVGIKLPIHMAIRLVGLAERGVLIRQQ
jgi:hypothetical protein